jgi:hypothetical protein
MVLANATFVITPSSHQRESQLTKSITAAPRTATTGLIIRPRAQSSFNVLTVSACLGPVGAVVQQPQRLARVRARRLTCVDEYSAPQGRILSRSSSGAVDSSASRAMEFPQKPSMSTCSYSKQDKAL